MDTQHQKKLEEYNKILNDEAEYRSQELQLQIELNNIRNKIKKSEHDKKIWLLANYHEKEVREALIEKAKGFGYSNNNINWIKNQKWNQDSITEELIEKFMDMEQYIYEIENKINPVEIENTVKNNKFSNFLENLGSSEKERRR